MSLTSRELNYLIWRYLQESGFELTAYSLNEQSQCSEYEENSTTKEILLKIKPGCLVSLVQKGLLYTVAESEATGESDFTLLAALIQDDIEKYDETSNSQSNNNSSKNRFMLKSEVALTNGNKNTDDENNDIEMTDADAETTNTQQLNESKEQPDVCKTRQLEAQITFPASLTCDWHPTNEVFAYGKDDGNAVINAIKDGKVIETRTLSHPNLLNIKNQINIVSWSPLGNLIITAGANSEIRAWSPDGKLKNIANSTTEDSIDLGETQKIKSIITSLSWSPNGKFLLSIDSMNQVSIWDGITISLVKQIKNLEMSDDSIACSCWVSEDKFAITTNNNVIKIFSIIPPAQFGGQLDIQPIGLLNGHEQNITIMKLNPTTKLLASCSDFDYAIKVWSSSSSQECLDLNTNPEKKLDFKLHTAPIMGLFWVPGNDDRSILLCISMEGILNIWDAGNSTNLKSSELFANDANFTEDMRDNVTKNVLIFNAVLSPNGKYLALGDDFCRVSIWEIDFENSEEAKDLVKCVAIYKPEINLEDEQKNSVGICDLKWDYKSKSVSASYYGIDSVIVEAVDDSKTS